MLQPIYNVLTNPQSVSAAIILQQFYELWEKVNDYGDKFPTPKPSEEIQNHFNSLSEYLVIWLDRGISAGVHSALLDNPAATV